MPTQAGKCSVSRARHQRCHTERAGCFRHTDMPGAFTEDRSPGFLIRWASLYDDFTHPAGPSRSITSYEQASQFACRLVPYMSIDASPGSPIDARPARPLPDLWGRAVMKSTLVPNVVCDDTALPNCHDTKSDGRAYSYPG